MEPGARRLGCSVAPLSLESSQLSSQLESRPILRSLAESATISVQNREITEEAR